LKEGRRRIGSGALHCVQLRFVSLCCSRFLLKTTQKFPNFITASTEYKTLYITKI